jgi:hypothetical protein
MFELTEGDSLQMQCQAQGNPEPKITWTKKGTKHDHIKITQSNSSLLLENLSELHADTYSCTADNGVGKPVTSDLLVLVKFKPRVSIIDEDNIIKGVMYSSIDREEQLRCISTAYPKPELSLYLNNELIPIEKINSIKHEEKRSILTYNFVGSLETFGRYTCRAENSMGIAKIDINVDPRPSDVTVNIDKLPIFSDAVIFEWSVLSASSIEKLNVQVSLNLSKLFLIYK